MRRAAAACCCHLQRPCCRSLCDARSARPCSIPCAWPLHSQPLPVPPIQSSCMYEYEGGGVSMHSATRDSLYQQLYQQPKVDSCANIGASCAFLRLGRWEWVQLVAMRFRRWSVASAAGASLPLPVHQLRERHHRWSCCMRLWRRCIEHIIRWLYIACSAGHRPCRHSSMSSVASWACAAPRRECGSGEVRHHKSLALFGGDSRARAVIDQPQASTD